MRKANLLLVFIALILMFQLESFTELTPGERNILSAEADRINLAGCLIRDDSWHKLPLYGDRDFWDNIPPSLRSQYIKGAEDYLDYTWPAVKATDYLEFIRSGDRRQSAYAAPSRALNSLVMGELVEGKGRFIDQIINAVWYYSEQTWWGWSAHLYFQKAPGGLPDVNEPTVDLGVGEIASDLAWTWYLFNQEFDKVHPLISERLKQEILNKAVKPYSQRTDFGYMGFTGGRPNNWNPWVNYNMLNCFLLLDDDQEKKTQDVLKIISSLDKFLNGYSDDGGCDEGPSYWGAAGALLYESLEILKNATGGEFDVYDNQLIRNIGTYFHKVNIHAPYFINFADADATTGGNPSAVYRYGKAISDRDMQQFGAYLARLNKWGTRSFTGKIRDQIRNLELLDEITNTEAREALVPDFWFPDTEVAGGRDSEGGYTGFFFGAKGGFNDESHNHNDAGSCVLYFDGKPCLIDVGRETYTAQTFSNRRYEIWTMQSGWHNLPVINGVEQMQGPDYKATSTLFTSNSRSVTFSVDIAGAYPSEASVRKWTRTYSLKRGKSFTISEDYELESKKDAVTSLHLITYCKVTETAPGILRFDGDGFSLNMKYNPRMLKPEIDYREVADASLKRYWPDGITRIRLDFINTALKGKQEVIFTPLPGLHVTDGWKAPEDLVKRLSENREGVNYFEEEVPAYTLPDPLKSVSGDIIRDRDDWLNMRRPELLELFRSNIYGRAPETEYNESFKIVNTNKHAMGGDATLKQIDINIGAGAMILPIHLTLFVPNNVSKPVPVFLLINNRDISNTDPSRKEKSEFWPAEEVISRGYAIAAFSNADVDPDSYDDFKNGIHGMLDTGERSEDAWGTIAAWAWGASRCMDYLALYNSLPVFRLFNSDNNIPGSVPPLGKPVFTSNVAYHVRAGEHNLKLEDWNHFMDFADRLWR